MAMAYRSAADTHARERVQLTVRGTVQGVGFRPFVYRTARDLGIAGSVANTTAGVHIDAEGPPEAVARFVRAIREGSPARVSGVDVRTLAPTGEAAFEIRPSVATGAHTATVLPDLATCEECLRELFDRKNRRYRYPFTNCTHCGPRYSIIEDLPYDRARTSMRRFAMCEACQREYENPTDRRFHAEPNACPACGPQLAFCDGEGRRLAKGDAALTAAATAVRDGAIVAVKGLGGFHLIADARNDATIRRLRTRKHREEKPFAIMFSTLAGVEAECELRPEEAALLTSPERPIVIVKVRIGRSPSLPAGEAGLPAEGEGRVEGSTPSSPTLSSELSQAGTRATTYPCASLASSVSPANPTVGAMLPYTPLHHLLLAELGSPVVATSGNRSEEPIVINEAEALSRLSGIADLFLVHDRPIVRPIDDSVARIVAGRPLLLRRARGYAPAPAIEGVTPSGILAFGGHLKATVALTLASGAVLGQHIGDLQTAEACDAYDRAIADLTRLHVVTPRLAVRDLHPDYRSSRVAEASALPTIEVQHHVAHVAACMAEHRLTPPALGVAFDGTGYGPDGTIWGGEFLLITKTGWRHVAHLRPFRLPGGEAAVREPRRSALGLLHELFGPACCAMTDIAPVASFTAAERSVLTTMLARGVNAPITTSAGRLFDAVAAFLDLRQHAAYEAEAAMQLEFVAGAGPEQGETVGASQKAYPFAVVSGDPMIVDWEPAIGDLLADIRNGAPASKISSAFHRGLANAIAEVALRAGEKQVVLTGGCFQNALLTEAAIAAVSATGLTPFWHSLVPPNDGGLALGQAAWAISLVERGEIECA